ncbi:hypothetical protein M4S82_05235 [Planococcus sp. MERTA32b]|nr:hypothetical protein [Planococcus sp. MER TA 32b]
MRMQKGLCIELNGDSSVFLGQNGEFVQGRPAGDIAVGEEGVFYPIQYAAVKKRTSKKPLWAPVTAALAVAVLFLSVLLPEQEAFAYVQIQVNPGVELGINEECDVVSIRELNADGRELIGELGEWKNHPLKEVLDEVIVLSMSSSTDEIVITTVADDKDQIADKAVVNSVMAISAKAMAKNVTVKLKEASKTQWRTSVEKSVPVGQLISNSQDLKDDEAEEKPVKEKIEQPLKVKEKPGAFNKPNEKDLKPEEKSGNEAGKPEDKEEKAGRKDNNQDENSPSGKEKEVPAGQEKRKETPAAEKGNPNPPGQEKRKEAPGQNKKDDSNKAGAPPDKKEEAPGQQKKKDKGGPDKGKVKPSKEKKERSKPEKSGPKNSNGKDNLEQPSEKSDKQNNGNSNKSRDKNKNE